MAPIKKRKRDSVANKSTAEVVELVKKPLKRLKKKVKATESESLPTEASSEKIVSDEKKVEDEKAGEVKEPDAAPVVKKKRASWLKLDKLESLIGSKSVVQSSNEGKDAKGNSKHDKEAEFQNSRQGREGKFQNSKQGNGTNLQNHKRDRESNGLNSKSGDERNFNSKIWNNTNRGEEGGSNLDKRHADSSNEKRDKIVNERHGEKEESDDEADKTLGGLIFMCNAKTKPDCLGYKLMGVPANKKEVVMGIEPGLTLFLYDYDLRLMYGVYKASSTGGMKLEPTAFGGGFPAQVRFTVHEDCYPLPENVFKKALKGSYDERTRKFKTELTVKQAKRLKNLFQPTTWLRHEGPSFVRHRDPTVLNDGSIIEKKYLNNDSDYNSSSSRAPSHEPRFLTEQEYRNHGLQRESHSLPRLDLPFMNSGPEVQREIRQHDPLFLDEKNYRTYGLSGPHRTHNTSASRSASNNACDPYDDSTESLVNLYLSIPMKTALSSERYPLPGREPYMNDVYRAADVRTDSERTALESGIPYPYYSSREPSENNQSESDLMTSGPVSRRYSFTG